MIKYYKLDDGGVCKLDTTQFAHDAFVRALKEADEYVAEIDKEEHDKLLKIYNRNKEK